MFKTRLITGCIFILFALTANAKDIYIQGADSEALQSAIYEAKSPDADIMIHLQAGQRFAHPPHISGIEGSLVIEGNGSIFGSQHESHFANLAVYETGSLKISGVTFININSSISCYQFINRGKLTLDRVSFWRATGQTYGLGPVCESQEFLLNSGDLTMSNVTIAEAKLGFPQSTVIRSLANSTASLSHITIVDTIEGTAVTALPGASVSINNSIIMPGTHWDTGVSYSSCVGSLTDEGGNLDSTGDCGFSGGSMSRDSISQHMEKGHDSWVFPLKAGSVAINAGAPEHCQKLDGRGFERGTNCDSGAYETGAANHGGELTRGGVSGLYYTPETDGNYIQVQRAYNGNVLVIWNTFDQQGDQAWVYGVGSYQNGVVVADTYRNVGGVLQPGGAASTATPEHWGTLTVMVHDCNNISVEYDSSDPEFGTGVFDATRVAYVHDLGCSE